MLRKWSQRIWSKRNNIHSFQFASSVSMCVCAVSDCSRYCNKGSESIFLHQSVCQQQGWLAQAPQNVFFPLFFCSHCHLKCSARLNISLETGHCYHGLWTLWGAIVPSMYTCHSWMERPLWGHWYRLLVWIWVYEFAECLGSPCVYFEQLELTCLCASVRRKCLCVSSLSQPAESAVSLRLTAGQKLEQEMNSDSPSASHKFPFSYSDTKDNISALH